MAESYTVEEICRLVKARPNFIREEIREGNLDAWMIGKTYRVEEDALAEWKRKRAAKRRRVSRLRMIERGAA